MKIKTEEITLVKTCGCCPEQYDALDQTGKQIGYLRLRWGCFSVNCPDDEGQLVYQNCDYGCMEGCFPNEEERLIQLKAAKDAIARFYNKN